MFESAHSPGGCFDKTGHEEDVMHLDVNSSSLSVLVPAIDVFLYVAPDARLAFEILLMAGFLQHQQRPGLVFAMIAHFRAQGGGSFRAPVDEVAYEFVAKHRYRSEKASFTQLMLVRPLSTTPYSR